MSRTCFNILILFFLSSLNFYAQLTENNDTLETKMQRIEISEIALEATNLNSGLLDIQGYLLSDKEMSQFETDVDTLIFKLNLQRENPRLDRLDALSLIELNNLDNEWKILGSWLNNIQSELTERAKEIEEQKSYLQDNLGKWKNTGEFLRETGGTASAQNQVESSINMINDVIERFRKDTEFMQDILARVTNNIIFVNDLIDDIQKAKDEVSRNMFQLNEPPVWKIFKSTDESSRILPRRSFMSDTSTLFRDFFNTYAFRLIFHLILSILIFIFVFYSFNNLRQAIPNDKINEINTIKTIIRRPVSSSLLVIFLISYFLYDNIPETINFINLVMIMVPVLIILYDILPANTRKFIWLPLIGTVLIQVHLMIYSYSPISRLLLLLIIVFCLLSLIWIIRGRTLRSYTLTRRIGKLLYFLSLVGLILISISLIAAVAGAVMLAEFITYATLRSAALILVFYALNRTVESIVYTTIYSKNLKKLNVISQYHNKIYRTTTRLIILISWSVWAILAFKLFSVWDNIYSGLNYFFTNDFSIGSINISLGNIIIFIFLIWFTIWFSRMVRIVFESEIATRVKMKRGVPGAVSLIMRIVIITVGFLLAIGAAGVEIDKLAILLGALGVGIGFGLQNIFNNLVSGIILAFERPIQEGDIIEVGEVWGTVKEIGIRASTVFTFDGAEVIVPNGNLISNEVINWTLTDQNRRAEVLVGVAYGTDPDKVLEILNAVLTKQDDILTEPAPLALFTGFGESSLDFRLLFWIPKAENRFVIQSNVNVAVNNAIKEAGIEIPFPQTDLHIRSVDKSVFRGLGKEDSK